MTQSQDERLGLPSASNWHRYEKCAGSFQLQLEAQKLNQLAHERSPAAQRGELIHAWLAGIPDEDGNEIKLDDSEQQTADFLQERTQEQAQRIFGDEPTQQLNEKRLWLTLRGQRMASGRFDRCLWTPSVALVVDWKTGFSEPDPAEQNAQLKVLAVLVALHLPSVKEVIVQIISGPFGVTEARYDRPALAKAWEEIMATLKAIQDPLAPLSPSLEACQYCPAVLICQPARDLLSPPTKFQTTTLPDDPDRAAKLLDEIAILEGVFDEVKKYYTYRLTADPAYRISNYAMVPGSIRREVTDWEAARRRLGEWLELEDIEGAANYRLGDLEKALGRKLSLKGKPLKERMGEILQGLIEEKPNAASLKRISGKPRLVEIAAP